VRLFEAKIPGGTRCFVKEYLAISGAYGKRELSVTRKLTEKYNEIKKNSTIDDSSKARAAVLTPTFPILLGTLKTDERIDNEDFKQRWSQKFPTVPR